MAKKIISLMTLFSLLAWSMPIQVWAVAPGDGSGTYNVPFNTDNSAKKTDTLPSQNFFSGAVEQSIDISVPPGRNGMQPSMVLSYSSLNGNSIAGQGWSLNLSFIKRSTKFGLPAFTNSDIFEYTGALGSDELVLVNAVTHEYRLKNENFTRFILQNPGDLANQAWEVFDKSGNQYFFGETDASRLKDGSRIAEWHLSRQIDTQSDYNIIEHQYVKNQKQIYPLKIEYGKTKNSFAHHASVNFIYEDRPDYYDSFIYGFKPVTGWRISKIETKLDASLVRRYQLTYIQSTAKISLLSKLKECGSDGMTCLPEREFTYQQNPASASVNTGYSNTLPGPWVDSNGMDQGYRFADVNSDGLMDVLRGYIYYDDKSGYNDPRLSAWINTGTAWQYDANWNPPVYFTEVHSHADKLVSSVSLDRGVIFGDVNNDGLIDIVQSHVRYEFIDPNNPSVTPTKYVYLNNGHGWAYDQNWTNSLNSLPVYFSLTDFQHYGYPLINYQYLNYNLGGQLVDVNNDGWLDIVQGYYSDSFGSNLGIYLNNHNGWIKSTTWSAGYNVYLNSIKEQRNSSYPYWRERNWNIDRGVRFADINNDGLVDIIQSFYDNPDWQVRKIWLNNGQGWVEDLAWTESFFNLYTWFNIMLPIPDGWINYDYGMRIFDINGDGLLDMVQSYCVSSSSCPKNVYLNNGYGFETNNANWASIMTYAFSDVTNYTTALKDLGYRAMDVNGDAVTDLFYIIGNDKQVYLTSGGISPKENLMLSAKNIYGGKTKYEYNPSTQYDNTGSDDISDLSQVIDVVKKVKQADWNNTEKSTVINYQDGKYDSLNRQMAGFGKITVTDEKGNKQEILNLQNDWDRGRVKEAIYYDNSNPAKKYSRAVNEYALDNVSHPTKPYINPLVAEIKEDYNGAESVQKSKRTEYQYDLYGNTTLANSLGDLAVNGDEKSAISSYVYNPDKWLVNRVKTSIIMDQNDIQVAKTDYYYDGQSDLNALPIYGNLTKKVAWLSSGTSPANQYGYDFNGNLVESIDPRGAITETFFDANNILPSQKIYNYLMDEKFSYDPATGNLLTSTDTNNQVTRNVYDALGQLIEVYKPGDPCNQPSVKSVYNWTSSPVVFQQMSRIEMYASPPQWPLKHYTYYDGFGRVIETKDFTLAEDNPNNLAVINATSYNQQGQIEKAWRPYFSGNNQANETYVLPDLAKPQTTYEYDALQRPKKIINPDLSFKSYGYEGWTTTAYDENNHRQDLTYDAYGNLSEVKEYNGSEIYYTNYQYDTLGSLVRISNNQQNQTTYTYDTLSRKLIQSDPDMGLWRYTYDLNGNLLTQKDARGKIITFGYDSLNRLITKKYSDGFIEKRFYDDLTLGFGKGRLTKVIDRSGTTEFTYDNRGQEIGRRLIIDNVSYSFNRSYDNLGRLTSYGYPNSQAIDYTYNWQGLLKSVPYSVDNIITNALGQTEEIQFNNGTKSLYSYDPVSARISRFEVRNPSGASLYAADYDFDSEGNLTSLSETGDNSFSFTYDGLDRLTQANGGVVSYDYAYNSLGNIVSNEGTSYYYGTKPHAVTNTSKGFNAQYDANGNMISRNSQAMVYDDENQITSWKSADGLTKVQYKYNYLGQRVKRDSIQQYYNEPIPVVIDSEGSVTQTAIKLDTSFRTSYGLVQASPLLVSSNYLKTVKHKNLYVSDDYEIRDGVVTQYVILNGQRLVAKTNYQNKYYHLDYLGSTKVVTDASANVAEKIYFKPYGATKQDTSPSVSPYKYTGKELDSENNLYYYSARYYDANIGRFITADSIIPSFSNPQSLNRYSYVVNNPYRYTDPTGHFYWEGFIGGVAQTLGGAVLAVGGFGLFFGGAATSPTGVGIGVAVVGAGAFVWGSGQFMQGLGNMYVAANTDADTFQTVEPIREGYQAAAGNETGDILYYGTDLGFSILTPKSALAGSKYLNAIINTIDKEQDYEAAAKLGAATLKYNDECAKEEQEKREAECLLSNSCISSRDDLLGTPSSNHNSGSQTSSGGSDSSGTSGDYSTGGTGSGGGGGAGSVFSGSDNVQEMIQRGIYY